MTCRLKGNDALPEVSEQMTDDRYFKDYWWAVGSHLCAANCILRMSLLRPFSALVFHHVQFPGRCPGLEYCALSGLKAAFASPCKGRPNKAQGNAPRKSAGWRIASPERAR